MIGQGMHLRMIAAGFGFAALLSGCAAYPQGPQYAAGPDDICEVGTPQANHLCWLGAEQRDNRREQEEDHDGGA